MKKVYISGAIAGHDLVERKAAFKAAERELAEMGFAPVNPSTTACPTKPIGAYTCGQTSPCWCSAT